MDVYADGLSGNFISQKMHQVAVAGADVKNRIDVSQDAHYPCSYLLILNRHHHQSA